MYTYLNRTNFGIREIIYFGTRYYESERLGMKSRKKGVIVKFKLYDQYCRKAIQLNGLTFLGNVLIYSRLR